MLKPETKTLEQANRQLASLISSEAAIPKPLSVYESSSIDQCHYHALLHTTKGQKEIQRDLIVRSVCSIASSLPLNVPFSHYDPENREHTCHAADLLQILCPDMPLVGEAYSLTLNPIPSNGGNDDIDEKKALLP